MPKVPVEAPDDADRVSVVLQLLPDEDAGTEHVGESAVTPAGRLVPEKVMTCDWAHASELLLGVQLRVAVTPTPTELPCVTLPDEAPRDRA
jgi:hypothetical protein